MVVMVDRLSASASEIVAAALQDYDRAVIVGDQSTHGKGTVQTLLPLNSMIRAGVVENPGKLKFTVSKFYRVAGGTTQKNGVNPDIVLPSIYDYMEFGEANLPNALPADRTKPAEYHQFNLTEPYLGELKRRSDERVNASTDFGYVNEDIARLKKQKEDKSISLNEAERIREKEELQAKAEARKKERASRKPLDEKVYEVTLETIEKDKPIVPVAAAKPKDNEQLAALSDPDDDGTEPEQEAAFDPELQETIRILHDYTVMLTKANGKKRSGELVLTD
jgi:carboxyl-terminal processing protease